MSPGARGRTRRVASGVPSAAGAHDTGENAPPVASHRPADSIADTAFSIAVLRAEEATRPESERLFEDPYAALFRPTTAAAQEATQRYVRLLGFRERVRLRTRFIDDAVRGGLGSGLTQLVLFGAGFDARGLRMPEIAERGATVFEIDTPSQLARKRAALTAAGIALPPTIAYVPFDFEASDLERALPAALQDRGFRSGAGAFFVWEGVIGYIDSAMVDRSLRFMASAGGPGTRVVFTYSDMRLDPYHARLRALRAGFSAFEEHTFDVLWRRYLPGEPHPSVLVSSIGVADR